MLVLTRREEEAIMVGDPKGEEQPIEITLLEVRGGQARIGITAPRELPVHRKEIWLEIREQQTVHERQI